MRIIRRIVIPPMSASLHPDLVRRTRRRPRWPATLGLLCSLSVVVGCAGIPVQDMSNARQTIRAALDAGAATVAPSELQQAQDLLTRAEASLQQRQYKQARIEARDARRIANEVLTLVQQRAGTQPQP